MKLRIAKRAAFGFRFGDKVEDYDKSALQDKISISKESFGNIRFKFFAVFS